MNRREYMNALAEQLSFLPEETRAAALSFYGEMLDDRMEDGMDEMSAVAAMASPEAIAARLRAENAAPDADKNEEQPAPADGEPRAAERDWNDEAARFSDLADRVMKRVSRAIENVPGMVSKGIENARGRMETEQPDWEKTAEEAKAAAREMREAAENMAREAREATESAFGEAGEANGKSVWETDAPEKVGDYERRIFTCPASSLRAVDLAMQDMPVCVKPAGDQNVTLIYYVSERAPYTARVENGTLTLTNPEKARGRGGFSFSMFGGGFHVLWNKGSPTVQLEMPADALVDLKIRTTNGSVRMDGLSALCQADLTTSNSRIDLKNIRCKGLAMATSNGRLSLENVESKQRIDGATSNARIEANGVSARGDVKLATSNGRIAACAVRSGGSLTLTTSNGRLQVEKLAGEQITLRSSNGEINGTLPGRQSDWAIESRTSNARNSLPASQPGAKPLSVHTSNAGISLRFEE